MLPKGSLVAGLELGPDVFVPGRARPRVAVLGRGQFVRGNASDRAAPIFVGKIEPESIGQGDVPLLERVRDFNDGLQSAPLGRNPNPSPGGHPDTLGILGTDPKCAVGVFSAPIGVAIDGVGGIAPALSCRKNEWKCVVATGSWLGGESLKLFEEFGDQKLDAAIFRLNSFKGDRMEIFRDDHTFWMFQQRIKKSLAQGGTGSF